MSQAVVTVSRLSKHFKTSMGLKTVRAVREVSFSVERGEVFGFVGPNGAGKTTTIRTLIGLIRPTAGSATVLGAPVPSPAARARLGFLPESPYFYEYLTVRELLDLTGRLFGLDGATRRRRGGELIERVGLAAAADRPLRKLSKGMLQRAGLAQALMNDPELVILDEPMSGLDPIGRKQVRDLIVELQGAGKTVFFSTHILTDVEAICDRVAIIVAGRVDEVGPVAKLLDSSLAGTDVVVRPRAPIEPVLPAGARVRHSGEGEADEVTIALGPDVDVNAVLVALAGVARVVSVTPRRESLEDVFLRKAREAAS
jgi:ABC-2 type transport system ATP-binding protein